MATTKTVYLVRCLVVVLQFDISFMRLKSAYGVYPTNMQEPSPPEQRLYIISLNQQPRERRWASSPRSGAPDRTADKRGHYRNQHQSEESDPNVMMEDEPSNPTQIVDMDHVYYTSKIYAPGDAAGKELWVNISKMEEDHQKVRGFLSSAHRQAERVNLSFDFPFYGHLLKEITVATGGFVYTGDIIHRILTATQYVAPLMANFDPSLSKNSSVFYFDNGTALVVQWNRLHLQDNISAGAFTFQAVLHSDGRIVYAYKEIPISISNISSENHPVKVGLSDAFMVLHELEQIPNVRRRTIYEYHKVDIPVSKISSFTAVEMLPLPTCLQFSSCGPCVTSQIGFNCSWCSKLQRCSSGFDRKRQDWVDLGCPEERRDLRCPRMTEVTNATSHHLRHRTTPVTASAGQQKTSGMTSTPETPTFTSPSTHSSISRETKSHPQRPTNKSAGDGAETAFRISDAPGEEENTDTYEGSPMRLLVGILVVMVLLAAAIITYIYVYNHPTSSASLFFMERRPTHWPILKFRRGSGRPSYAEVEAPGQDRDSIVVIDPKKCFVISDRRESEQKEGFVIPDQRERFLSSESS